MGGCTGSPGRILPGMIFNGAAAVNLNRRAVLATSTGLAFAFGTLLPTAEQAVPGPAPAGGEAIGLHPDTEHVQTALLQAAIDAAQANSRPVFLPPGRFLVPGLKLRRGTRLIGAYGATTLAGLGEEPVISAHDASDILIDGISFDGLERAATIIALVNCHRFRFSRAEARNAAGLGVRLEGCSGSIHDCQLTHCGDAGILALDSTGLEIARNTVSFCGNNGIQVWRSQCGVDGSMVTGNRISNIAAQDGGDGPNGNGINVFRAGNVMIANNMISDCAFSAVRGNAASNIQIIANSCLRLGEVALYAEFGFEGAVIAQNIVDTSASGIAVTNFNEGGRLAAVQGNLIRNLFRREHEPVDKRGEGITIEADAAVSGNTIEQAPTAGISIGWGPYMRDVSVTGNVIRKARVGITISSDQAAGPCLIANNVISGSEDGAIRAMDHGRAHGPDLALAHSATKPGWISITGNLAT